MTDALVLRQRVRLGEADAVGEFVAEQLADRHGSETDRNDHAKGSARNDRSKRGDGLVRVKGSDGLVRAKGSNGLVRAEGVHTASLFLDRRDEDAPGLVWYVEVEDASNGPWADPVSTLIRTSPLFDAGLGNFLETPDSARIVSDDSTAADVLVHATLPGRPSSVEGTTDAMPAFRSPDDATGPTPDVVLLRLKVKSGFGERFVRALAGLTSRLDDEGRIERKFDEWTEPVIEDEGMWTETIFLERTDGRYYLLWYMEAKDIDDAYDAYFESPNAVARVSEYVIGWVLADPKRALSPPGRVSDYELLAHAVSAGRSGTEP